MNEKLKKMLMDIFNLTESEFSFNFKKQDITSWDSLKHMELISSIEKEFQVNLEMLEIVQMRSIPDIINILKNKGISFEK